MSHYTPIRPLGWDFLSVLASAEMAAIDVKLTAAVHEGGGTWNFTSVATFGGTFGFNVSAPFIAGDLRGNVKDTHALTLENNSRLDVLWGARAVFASGSQLSIEGATGWPAIGLRNLDRWAEPVLIGGDNVEVAGMSVRARDGVNVLRTELRVSAGDPFSLAIPRGPQNSRLVSVHVAGRGWDGTTGTGLTLPTYRIMRQPLGNLNGSGLGAQSFLSAIVSDTHGKGAAFLDYGETVITPLSSLTFAPHQNLYWLACTPPWNSAESAAFDFIAIGARYELTQLRP